MILNDGFDLKKKEYNEKPERIEHRKEIACQCWFTKSGDTVPLMIKYEDDDGTLYTIKNIQINSTQKKKYDGIATIEHSCTVRVQGIEMNIILIFHPFEGKWNMIYESLKEKYERINAGSLSTQNIKIPS